jgi:penicillin-binding protein 1C
MGAPRVGTRGWRRRLGVAALGLVALGALAIGLDRLLPPPLARVADRGAIVVDARGAPLRAFAAPGGTWRFAVDPDAVDPLYLRMLMAWEDRRFTRHPGVDPLAIGRAIWQAARAGGIVSGASTISMQTARLVEPRPRTLGAKLVEMARAIQLEARLGKAGVLALYLDLAPFGGNLEGVRAASLFYFGKEPDRLDAAEAALLVALPQSPERRRPDRFPETARAERDRVLARMAELGVISGTAAREAMAVPVPDTRRATAFAAPHLAERVRAAAPTAAVVRATIDGDLQGALERLARAHVRGLEAQATMAILVVANADRNVVGYVGSSDYLDQQRGGPIDMVRAVRSPGSALKPFIYGLGFDDLALAPATIMVDRPTRFGGWAPRNFDRLYRGEVTAAEALQLSLNIPAVAVLQRVGPLRFLSALDDAGAPLTLPDDDPPGLPIALGGVGISLESLVTLYAGLADGGRVRPLRLTPDAPMVEGTRLVSPTAAWYLTRILADTPPPPNLMPGQHTGNGRIVSFKTGTSYGFRDAWAIGYDRDYTVGVWVGRADGGFSAGRMGREAAAPALFEAFSLLPPPGPEAMMPPPSPPCVRLASNADLAPALRRFGAPGVDAGPARSNGPVIAFPPPGAMLELARDEAGAPRALPLRVEGGRMPLTWMVNGQPIGRSTYRRQAEWLPDGAGAARIIVVDGAGQMASAEIWLQ